MMSDFTQLPKNIADCMKRAGSPLSDDQYMLLAGYLAERQSHTPSAAWLLEMADCLKQYLDDINEAISATMRAGNNGKLRINGQELSTLQVADRMEYLMKKRERISRALKHNPAATHI